METLSSDKVFFIVFLRNQTGGILSVVLEKIKIEFTVKPDGVI